MAVMEQTELQVRQDGRWLAVAVIDGRRYPDQQSYERAVDEAFATMNGLASRPSSRAARCRRLSRRRGCRPGRTTA